MAYFHNEAEFVASHGGRRIETDFPVSNLTGGPLTVSGIIYHLAGQWSDTAQRVLSVESVDGEILANSDSTGVFIIN